MASGITPKEGDPTPAAGDWWTYNPQSMGPPPVLPIQTTPSGSSPGRWSAPMVAPNFQYPPGLLAQIAQAQQPRLWGQVPFGRFGFSNGTPTPGGAPPGWGRAPAYGAPWAQPPVGWNGTGAQQPPPMPQQPFYPQQAPYPQFGPQQPPPQQQPPQSPPPLSFGSSGADPRLGGGNSIPGLNSGRGMPNPPQAGGADTTGSFDRTGLAKAAGLLGIGSRSGAPNAPSGPPPSGLLTWGNPAAPSGQGMTPAAQPAQAGWAPTPGQSPQQMMASYMAYANQSPQSFLTGFRAQQSPQAQVQYLMGLPPSASQALMNDPGVQQALGGANWRQNFMQGYYNAPAR